mmetsp:Transcript_6147/g.25766  ORF Transcript_6147/g.25766 Transcript_6147/m.25766 type:complete len:286 (+) Transcript_6147:492-1349(+)
MYLSKLSVTVNNNTNNPVGGDVLVAPLPVVGEVPSQCHQRKKCEKPPMPSSSSSSSSSSSPGGGGGGGRDRCCCGLEEPPPPEKAAPRGVVCGRPRLLEENPPCEEDGAGRPQSCGSASRNVLSRESKSAPSLRGGAPKRARNRARSRGSRSIVFGNTTKTRTKSRPRRAPAAPFTGMPSPSSERTAPCLSTVPRGARLTRSVEPSSRLMATRGAPPRASASGIEASTSKSAPERLNTACGASRSSKYTGAPPRTARMTSPSPAPGSTRTWQVSSPSETEMARPT